MAYEKKTITVNGNKYELQRMALRQYTKHKDKCKINGVLQEEPFYEGLMENVLINPKMTFEDFDEGDRFADFDKVMDEIIAFQQPK